MQIKDCLFQRVRNTSVVPSISNGTLKQPEDEYRIFYILDGAGFIRINGQKHILRSDFLFMTYPMDTCSIAPLGAEVPYTGYILSFIAEEGDEELFGLLRGPILSKRVLAPGRNLRFLFAEMLANFSSAREASLAACAHFLLGLLHSLSSFVEEEPASASSISYVERAVQMLRAGIHEKATLEGICESLHITGPHFIRIFKAYMGVPPMKYLMRLRMEEAYSLLGETNLPIYQIAESLSFSSEAHFSRTFKQHQGMSPMSYRISQLHNLKTKHERTEKDLQIANRMIQTIIDASPDLIFCKNVDSVNMWCNDAYARFVGLPKERILGRSDFEIHPKHLAEFFLEKDRLVFKNDKATKNEEWLLYPDGDRKKFEVYKAPIHDPDGTILGLLGVSRDITDREAAVQRLNDAIEEGERTSRQKDDLLVIISDELLASIENIRAEMQLEGSEGREPGSFKNVDFACNYLAVLAKEIVAFTRFESGEEEPSVSEFSLAELCTRLRESLNGRYGQTIIDVRLRLEKSIPKILFGDEHRLYRLATRLITAFVKCSKQVLIELGCSYANSVATLGIRISQAHFSGEMIESFSRLSEIAAQEQSSLMNQGDLGFSIAGKLLRMMDGSLTLKNLRTELVEFEVGIPLASSAGGHGRRFVPALSKSVAKARKR